MEDFTLEIAERTGDGSSNSRRERREGKVPVAIYSPDGKSVSGVVIAKDFIHIAEKARFTDVITFKSSVKDLDGKRVLVKEVQKEPLSGKVHHVDFQALVKGHTVRVKVPVLLEGIPVGVKTQGGIITKSAQTLSVSCIPTNIPHDLHVDITELKVGDSILAENVQMPEGATLISKAKETVAAVVSSRQTKLMATETDAGAEGEETASEEPEVINEGGKDKEEEAK